MATPALVIDGTVKAVGRVVPKEEIKEMLDDLLTNEAIDLTGLTEEQKGEVEGILKNEECGPDCCC